MITQLVMDENELAALIEKNMKDYEISGVRIDNAKVLGIKINEKGEFILHVVAMPKPPQLRYSGYSWI